MFTRIFVLIAIVASTAYTADADLKLSENSSPSPDPVNIGQEVTFVTRLKNLGPDTAKPNQVIEFTYDQDVNISSVSVTSNGVTCSPTSGSLSQGSKITCTKTNNTNKGGIRDITIKAEPTQRGTLKQVATISSSGTNDPRSSNDTLTSSVTVVQRTGTCTGCDCSYDTGNNDFTNDSSPGVKITQLDNKTSNVQKCISGVSEDGGFFAGDEDYYYFTAGADGNVTINTSSPNNHDFHLKVTSGGSVVYPDTSNTFNHHVTFSVSAGDRVILYFKETGNDTDQYEATISATFSPMPPILSSISDQSAILNTAFSFDLSQYVTPTNGDPITAYHLSCTIPGLSFDTATGILSGTPTQSGTTSCTASAEDKDGTSNTRTFDIKVADRIVEEGVHDFTLINPPSTRNIIGNFAVLGNTVECITTSKKQYGGTCTDSNANTNNNYMVRYIDIDNDPATWNSSSSNFTLPTSSYDNSNGDGILWAGLFWQGSVHGDKPGGYTHYDQRRASLDGNGGWSYTDIQGSETVSIPNTDADKVWIKIDNDPNYTKVQAKILYYNKRYGYHGERGGFYAAFTDITTWLKGKHLGAGKHTLTLANLTTNEGREVAHGNYGGWSMVVIYREKGANAKARNISIYNGYANVDRKSGVTSVKISGFRLPNSGQVNASFSAFAGEGEYLYGAGHGEYDRMVISRHADLSHPDTMPGATDPDNIFDAILANIDRDNIGDNKLSGNNCGIDVENYDVSSIMTDYRDKEHDINTVYIGLSSSRDYITPSMMAFSAELYKPQLCYDYAVDLGTGTVYTDDDHNITGPISADRNMTTKVFIKTTQADFDLENSILVVKDLNASKWDFDGGEYSPSTSMAYFTADINDSRADYSAIGFGDDDGNMHDGGIIHPDTNYYAKFYHTLKSGQPLYVRDHLDIDVVSHIDFGSGAVPYRFSTEDGSLPRCATSLVYNPIYGRFSVERNNNTGETIPEKYTLYTQISGREFPVDVVSYDGNSSTELTIDKIGVEVELFDAATFENNASSGFDTVCRDYDKHRIHNNQFVAFSNASRAPLKAADLAVPIALRSAAFRVWYIADVNNSLVFDDTCYTTGTAGRDSCFAGKYPQIKSRLDPTGLCSAQCTGGGSGCYECLKVNFGHPVCSRDNFAIRPESYRIVIKDAGKDGNNTNRIEIARNNTTNQFEYAAGYKYRIEANATLWHKEDNARKYYKIFGGSNVTKLKFDGNSTCTDRNGTEQSTYIFDNGKLSNIIAGDNAGNYTYDIVDKDWTAVDQKGNPLKPYRNFNDCNKGSGDVDLNPNKRSGCQIKSELDTTHTQMKLWFHPYAFDVSGIRLQTHPHTGSSWVYMNNLHTVGSQSDTMAAVVEGNITAVGAHGKRLSNYTASCAAKDIGLSTKFISDPSPVVDANGNTVDFEQIIKDNSGVFDPNSIEKADNNLTLPSDYFDNNGTAEVAVYYNFKKPYDKTVNVADVNFTTLLALGINDKSNADMQNNYIPTGDVAIDQNASFYFAKVAPPPGIDGTTVYDPSIDVDFRVLAYCDTAIKGTCRYPGMDPNSVEGLSGTAGWYLMSGHQSALGDGKVTTLSVESTDPSGHAGDVSISNIGPILFTNGVYTTDTLGCAFDKRPLKATFVLDPDEWLKYNPGNADGRPRFDLYFLREQLNWKGMGETGHVISTEPHHNQSGRMGW